METFLHPSRMGPARTSGASLAWLFVGVIMFSLSWDHRRASCLGDLCGKESKVTTPSDVPTRWGHCTLKKVPGPQKWLPCFNMPSMHFWYSLQFNKHCIREFTAFAEQCSIRDKCPGVSWLCQVDPEMARWVWPFQLPVTSHFPRGVRKTGC